MSRDSETLRVYDARAEEYAQLVEADATGRWIKSFISKLPAGGAVLDLGCGPGASAEAMADAGFCVDAIDASDGMIALARARRGVNAIKGSFEDLDAIAKYDGIWANFSLLHAPRHDFAAHLERIARALKPLGYFHIGLKLGEGEGRDEIGRFYTYFQEDELMMSLKTAGFEPCEISKGRDPGLSGHIDPWITCISQKTAG